MLDDPRRIPGTHAECWDADRQPLRDLPAGQVAYVHVAGAPGEAQLFRAEIAGTTVGGIVERTDRTWGWYLFPRYGGVEGDATHEDLARDALEATLGARRRVMP